MKITLPLLPLSVLVAFAFAGCEVYQDFYTSHVAGSTTGTGGMGGAGGAGVCKPGETAACYDGPAGTEGIGVCKAGTRTCNPDGAAWGACVGERLPQPENCGTLAEDDDCDGTTPPCAGDLVWALRSGEANDQRAFSVAVDSAGNALVTGFFKGSLGFPGGTLTSAGGADVFLVKLDSAGTYVWGKAFGDQGDQYGASVAVDSSGNVLVTGRFSGAIDLGGGALVSAGGTDVFLAKLSTDGAYIWSKVFGGSGDQWGASVKSDVAGNVVLAGYLSGTGSIDFGGGSIEAINGSNGFTAKLDAIGTHLWSKGFGVQSGALAYDLAVDGAGNAIVTGQFTVTLDLDSGPVTSAGGSDVFVAKFDPNGVCNWGKRFGDDAAQIGRSVATNTAGDVFVTGQFQGSMDVGAKQLSSFGGYDIFLLKIDSAGAAQWGKRFGLSNDQIGTNLAADSAGNLLLTGQLFGTADFGGNALTSAGASDVFLAKFDSAGGHLWSKRFGDAADLQAGYGVASDAANNILVVGFFEGAVDFGGGPLVSAGGSDVFVAKLSP